MRSISVAEPTADRGRDGAGCARNRRRRPTRAQARTAPRPWCGADKTRIIRILDDPQDDGYIERRPDPDDRRARLLAITDAGRRVKDAVHNEIQRGEERWLGELSAEERRTFLRVLERLTPREWG